MKTTNWVLGMLAVFLFALAGCKKTEQPVAPPREFYGVKVNLPKLERDFTNASPEAQAGVVAIKQAFRYGQFLQAMMELDKLANTPNLTEPQKKLVKELMEQTKQVIAKVPPPPQQ